MNGPALLGAHLKRTGQTPTDFAPKVRADRAQIHRLLSGERRPGLDLALRIDEKTGGAVPAASWRDDEEHASKVSRPARSRKAKPEAA